MKVLVVYDSFFGNTKQVAEAIGSALCDANPLAAVEVARITDVRTEQLQGVDLLLVGSPTRAFRPSPGTTQFLKQIHPTQLIGARVAAFDTRINPQDTNSGLLKVLVRLFGYAAPAIEKQLAKKGALVAGPCEGFEVRESEGPLKEGELARAARWAISLN